MSKNKDIFQVLKYGWIYFEKIDFSSVMRTIIHLKSPDHSKLIFAIIT